MQNEFDTFHSTFNPADMEILSNLLMPPFQPEESASPAPQVAPSSPEFFADSPSYTAMTFHVNVKAEPMSPVTPQAPRVAQLPNIVPQMPVATYAARGAPQFQANHTESIGAMMLRGARASVEALNNASSSSDEYEERPAPGKMSGRSTSPAQNEEERIVRRRKKNREAAQQSRLRKRLKLESLESQLNEQRQLHEFTVNQKIQLEHENVSLRKQVEYLKEVLRNCHMVKMESPSAAALGRVAV